MADALRDPREIVDVPFTFAVTRPILYGFTTTKFLPRQLNAFAGWKQGSFPKSFFFHECCGAYIRLVNISLVPQFPNAKRLRTITGKSSSPDTV